METEVARIVRQLRAIADRLEHYDNDDDVNNSPDIAVFNFLTNSLRELVHLVEEV